MASGICGIPLLLAGLIWLLHTRNTAVPLPSETQPAQFSPLFDTAFVLVFSVPAALIVSRQPRNLIGWLLAAIGYGVSLSDLTGEYGFYAIWTAPGSLPGGIPVLAFADSVSAWLTYAPVPLLLLLFPDGRLPSRRWWLVAWAALAALTVSLTSDGLYPGRLNGDPQLPANPIGIHGWEHTLDTITELSASLFFVFLLAALTAPVVRFRRAHGVERQQLKWFTYGAIALVVTLIGFLPLAWAGLAVLILMGFGVFTACVAVAMLRYHLYDIDRLINRTLVYGLLTLTLTLTYVAVVFVLRQALVGSPHGRHASLAVAGSTLIVAALFQPARRRIQAAVDRHFNRRHYDAAKTVETFSARLREDVDLDSLTHELLDVVDQTMQPTKALLWLRSAEEPF